LKEEWKRLCSVHLAGWDMALSGSLDQVSMDNQWIMRDLHLHVYNRCSLVPNSVHTIYSYMLFVIVCLGTHSCHAITTSLSYM
jgi:hypothetical protein